ncbi:MAG: hypothetical protein HYZ44_16165 [Bacteroidetes bacterium]|nr:hypothetical protein [Bacteroidota bacterium]
MLRFFRYNDPYRLLAVLFILIVISLPLFISPAGITWHELKDLVLGEALNDGKSIYTGIVDDTAPIAAWFNGWMDFVFGHSLTARHITALLLIFFQASFFAVLLISNKAYNENTYLPALIFGVLGLFSFDMLALSQELLASTILLFALNNLFKDIEFREQRDEVVFNLGIYLGLASLILFSCFVFLPGTLIILSVFTRMNLRKALLLIFSFALPHLMLFSFFFLKNNERYLIDYFYAPNLTFHTEAILSASSLLWLTAVPIIYLLFSMVMLNREAHFTKYQSQLLQVMLLWLVIAFVHLVITRERTPHSFYFFLPPLTYFINHYLLLIRRKRLAEVMLLLLLTAVISISLMSKSGKWKAINYDKLFAIASAADPTLKGKRILLLEKNEGYYLENKLAASFLNWDLSKNVFNNPDEFENINQIDRSFQQDAPEVIIDKDNLMNPFFERLPAWKARYKKEGTRYYKISN